MDDSIFYAGFFLPAAAAVIIFFMKYVSAVLQARVRLKEDKAYRDVATKAVAAQAETAAALAAFAPALADIQRQLAVVEKILRDVD